jgi:ABC-type antimicrobial peptide transport system permease subunit
MSQRAQFAASIAQDVLVSRLAQFFSRLAILLVASGLYGTLAYRVSRRKSEFGVRMAVGCGRAELLWMVLPEGVMLSVAGIVVGVRVAFAFSQYLDSQLFGLAPHDPLTFGLAVVGLLAVCLAAGLIPAYRATSIDPIRALRYE